MAMLIILSLFTNVVLAQDVASVQPFQTTENMASAEGQFRLTNLNSHINGQFLLVVTAAGRSKTVHLHNPSAPITTVALSAPDALVIRGGGQTVLCPKGLLEATSPQAASAPYAPICGGRLFVRNNANGHQPSIEKISNTLRGVWGGEALMEALKPYKTAGYAEESDVKEGNSVAAPAIDSLTRAELDPKFQNKTLVKHDLGVALDPEFNGQPIRVGEWYPVQSYPGIAVTMIAPGMVSKAILSSHSDRVRALEGREVDGLAYLIAFDLGRYTFGWAHGTKLPGVGWSDRLPSDRVRAFGGGAGPSGIGTFGAFANPGQVPPSDFVSTVATISGGFQLHHGHIMRGTYANQNKSSHYGYIEDGVILANPVPGLATVVAYVDRTVTIKTWTADDNRSLAQVRYLRQNGMPLIDGLGADGRSIPGAYVGNRPEGNWSGSAAGDNYTPRGAACLIERNGHQFLVYGYFSAATPNSLARVFQAYGCKSAIHLDMNSPGQAYLTLLKYTVNNGSTSTEPLVRAMRSSEPAKGVARYFAAPDFRDFFWIMKK